MLYVELRRTVKGVLETRRLGPFKEITYGGFTEAELLCDGKSVFSHWPRVMGLVTQDFDPNSQEPWAQAVITSK